MLLYISTVPLISLLIYKNRKVLRHYFISKARTLLLNRGVLLYPYRIYIDQRLILI